MASPYDALLEPEKQASPYDALLESPAASPYDALLSESPAAQARAPLLSSVDELMGPPKASGTSKLPPLDTAQFLTQADPTMGKYAGVSAIGEPYALDNPSITTADEFRGAYQTPILSLPKPKNTGIGSGITRGVETVVEGLTTPENIALLASIEGAPAVLKSVGSAAFATMMASSIPEKAAAAGAASATGTPGETAERVTETAATALLAGLAATNAATGRAPMGKAERAASMEAVRQRRAAQEPLPPAPPPESLVPGLKELERIQNQPATPPSVPPTPEAIDGLLVARRKTTDPAEVASIDQQLANFDPALVSEAEARAAKSPAPPAAESASATPEIQKIAQPELAPLTAEALSASDAQAVAKPLRIAQAAVQMPDGTIYTGATHALAEDNALQSGRTVQEFPLRPERIGYVDSEGNFRTRQEALEISRAAKQISEKTAAESKEYVGGKGLEAVSLNTDAIVRTPESIRALTKDSDLRAAAREAGLSDAEVARGYDEMGVDWLKDRIIEENTKRTAIQTEPVRTAARTFKSRPSPDSFASEKGIDTLRAAKEKADAELAAAEAKAKQDREQQQLSLSPAPVEAARPTEPASGAERTPEDASARAREKAPSETLKGKSPLDQLRELESEAKPEAPVEVAKPANPQAEKMVADLDKVGRVNRDKTGAIAKELQYYSPEERAQLQEHFGAKDANPETLAQAITGRPKLRETETPTTYVNEPAGKEGRGHPTADVAKEAFGEDYTGGPGAMGPREAAAMEAAASGNAVSIAKEKVRERRAKEGNLPVLDNNPLKNEEAYAEGERRLEKDPNYGASLIDSLRSREKTSVDVFEEAALIHEAVTIRNARNAAAERAGDIHASEAERELAREQFKRHDERLNQLDEATKLAGESAGRALQFRKVQIREDYTFQGIERQLKKAGVEMTPEKADEIKAKAEKIKKSEEDVEKAAKKRATTEHENTSDSDFKETKKKVETSERQQKSKGRKIDISKQRERIIDGMKKRVAEGDSAKDLYSYVQKLHENLQREALRNGKALTRDEVTNQIHDILTKEIGLELPKEFTGKEGETNTQDLISGIGLPLDKSLTTDAAKLAKGEIRTQLQKVGKINRFLQKQPAPKTGPPRMPTSAETRALEKEGRELARRNGVQVTDPAKQLASSLESKKTRLRNEIADLDRAIALKEPLVQKTGADITDAETASLEAQRNAKKAEYTEMFGDPKMTDEARLKVALAAALRAEQAAGERLADARNGIFDRAQPGRKVTSPELEAIKARAEATQAEVQQLKDLDTAYQQHLKDRQLETQGDALLQRLAEGEKPPAGKDQTPDTEAQAARREQNEALRAAIAEIKEASPGYRSKLVQDAVDAAQKSLDEYDRRLRDGDFSEKAGKNVPLDDAELARVRAERDAVAEFYREAKAQTPEAQAAKLKADTQRAETAIAALEKEIAEGVKAAAKAKAKTDPPALAALKEKRDGLRKYRDELRRALEPQKTPEEIALQSAKTRLMNRNADLLDRLANNNFDKPVPKAKPAPDAELRHYQHVNAQLKASVHEEVLKLERLGRSKPRIALDALAESYHTLRAIMTGGEFSGVLRQGKAAIGRPILVAKGALPAMFRAFRSERNEFAEMERIRENPNFEVAKKAGLEINDPNQFTKAQLEGNYRSRWANKIPFIAGSGRAYTVFFDKLRMDLFDVMASKLVQREGEMTPEQAKVIADAINVQTGAGNLGVKGTKAAELLNVTFFAPKFTVSRFQLVYQTLKSAGDAATGFKLGNRELSAARRVVAEEHARMLIGFAAMYSLYSLMGDDKIERDPRSGNFGKIPVKGANGAVTYIDPMAGIIQATVFMARLRTGETKEKDKSGKMIIRPLLRTEKTGKVPFGKGDLSDVSKQFLRSKLAPLPGALYDRFLTGEDFKGQPVTISGQLISIGTPMTYGDIYDAMRAQGMPKAAALSALAMFGESVNTYNRKKAMERFDRIK